MTTSNRKKLLWITYTLPYFPGGGAHTRQYFLIKAAAEHFDIFLVSTAKPDESDRADSIKPFCCETAIEINLIKKNAWNALRSYIARLCAGHAFDFILLDQSDIAHWAERFPKQNCAIGINAHNVNFTLWSRIAKLEPNWFKKAKFYLKALQAYHYDQRHLKKLDAVFTCSKFDTSLLKNLCTDINAITISNGVDTSYFNPKNKTANPHQAVFTGSLIYEPNSEACLWFIANVLPKLSEFDPRFVFNIVGFEPPRKLLKQESRSVRIISNVPDVRPFIDESTFFVVPLHSGSGTRLKILEAMAMEKVVISTALGAEGIEGLVHMKNIVFAEAPEEFADHIKRLQELPEAMVSIGKSARLLVKEKYEWFRLGAEFVEEIGKLI